MIIKVAGDVVQGLKSSPTILALVILNVALVASTLYFGIKVGDANAARFQMILDRCLPKG